MSEKKTKRSLGVLLLACGVCCLPLIVPILAGGFAAGAGLMAVLGQGYWVAIGLVVALAGPAFVYFRKQRHTSSVSAGNQCGCTPNSGCGNSDSCQLPDKSP